MADIITYPIVNGEPADGDKLQTDLEDIESFFPVTKEWIASLYASTLDFANFVLPPQAFPPGAFLPAPLQTRDQCFALLGAPQLSFLSGTVLHAQSHGLQFNRQQANELLLSEGKRDVGWLAPIRYLSKYAFIVCDGFNNRITVQTPAGGPFNHTVQKIGEWEVGDTPAHACRTAQGDIWVACDGDPSIWRVSGGSAKQVVSSAALTTAGGLPSSSNASITDVTGFRKIYTNRFGTYIYVIAKSSDTSEYDSIVKIRASDSTVVGSVRINKDSAGTTASVATGEHITDLVIFYPDESMPHTCFVAAAQRQEVSTGTEAILWTFKGDNYQTDTSWGALSFSSASDVALLAQPLGQADEQFETMVATGTSLYCLGNYTSAGTKTAWSVVNYDHQRHVTVGTIASGFQTLVSGTETGMTDAIMAGSASPGREGVYALAADGDVVFWPRGYTALQKWLPKNGWETSPETKSSVAWNGFCLALNASKSGSDGDSLTMSPF